jgi:DNA-binding MarR family transcriptional regulator
MSANQKESPADKPVIAFNQIIHAPARLNILVLLYVVTNLDYVFLKNQTGLSWGNLATHLKKLEEAGYVTVQKGYQGKKPQSIIQLTSKGRTAFQEYKKNLQQVLDDLPE